MSSEQYFEQLWKDALEKYFASTDETPTRKALLKQINTADDFQNHLEQLATPDDLKSQLQADQDKFQTFRKQHGQYLL
jgi:general stress protein 26